MRAARVQMHSKCGNRHSSSLGSFLTVQCGEAKIFLSVGCSTQQPSMWVRMSLVVPVLSRGHGSSPRSVHRQTARNPDVLLHRRRRKRTLEAVARGGTGRDGTERLCFLLWLGFTVLLGGRAAQAAVVAVRPGTCRLPTPIPLPPYS
ncbi:hypothetical protein PVAP13_5NG295784 [Panicum virgatum]|uniref:Uncharacterized protein n=1 Tax=Panicum virgatum TaxID=38727 RepID=A0A8T0RZR6_PANVG|nr:hypothetical protein PVAP13_5NG295784 [Panicum virgatum]